MHLCCSQSKVLDVLMTGWESVVGSGGDVVVLWHSWVARNVELGGLVLGKKLACAGGVVYSERENLCRATQTSLVWGPRICDATC